MTRDGTILVTDGAKVGCEYIFGTLTSVSCTVMLVHELAHANDDMPNTLAQDSTKGSEKVRVLFCRDFCQNNTLV